MMSSVNMTSIVDLKLIREILKDFKTYYPNKSVWFQKFLATRLYLDADNHLDFVLKNRSDGVIEKERVEKAYNWVSKFLHGLRWDRGEYPYSYLDQICDSIPLRNQNFSLFC